MSDDLRRVLKDPGHRLPDSLVDLDAVHTAARHRQRSRTGLAAVGGAVAVVAISLAVVHPWNSTDGSLPVATTRPTPAVSTSPSPAMSPAPTPTPTPDPSGVISGDETVVGLSAISDSTWWVLSESPATCLGRCVAQLLQTVDGGSTFTIVSQTDDQDGIPAGTTEVRFFGHGLGYALRAQADPGHQVWQTVDGGHTWRSLGFSQQVLALEAGGGTGWLLVQDGRRIGVAALDPGLFENPRPPVWLGTGSGVHPALTVQGGDAVVFWFTDSASRLSVVTSGGQVVDRVNPCTRDVGVGAVSATVSGLAVSCHLGSTDGARSSDDGGRTWSSLQDGPGRLVVGNINGGLTVIGGQDGRLTLAAPGASQPMVTHGAKATGAWSWIGFTSETSGFALDASGQLFRTTDGGASWAKVSFHA